MSGRVLKVGTRGSKLALEQARRVREKVSGPSEIIVIRTSGDRFQDKPLSEQQGIGFFTKEIENELLAGNIDVAVHSLKDLPTTLAAGLTLGAVLERDEASDLLLVRPDAHEPGLPFPVKAGSRIGASAMRRQALLGALCPGVQPAPIRGNVPTRVDKARNGDFEAVILSRAGLVRLGLDPSPLIAYDLNPHRWICAPGQGVIAVEARENDPEVLERLTALEDEQTRTCVDMERSLLVTYGSGCHAPFGSWLEPVPEGYRLFIAAPGRNDSFRVGCFVSADLAHLKSTGDDWIRSGDAAPAVQGGEEWVCRQARPWF
jgi:hydroxymethylbilane synthase